MTVYRFRVNWGPVPQGSPRVFANKGKVGVANSPHLIAYREAVAAEAKRWITEPLAGAVFVAVSFYLPRPKSVKVAERPRHVVKPDIDKLVRALLDSLTHVAYKDDAQVVRVVASKHYAHGEPWTYVEIRTVRNSLE